MTLSLDRKERWRKPLAFGLLALLCLLGGWQAHVLKEQLQVQRAKDVRSEFREVLFVRSQAAVIAVDADTNLIVDWNYGAERYFGWRTHEVIGYEMDFLLPEDLRDDHVLKLQDPDVRKMLLEKAVRLDCWVYTKSGKPRYMNLTVRGLVHDDRYYFIATLVPPQNVVRVPLETTKPPVQAVKPGDTGPRKSVEELLPKLKD